MRWYFKGWCNSAVLPYLDLQFWAENEGVRIHQYIMAEAIFPDAYAVGAEVDPIGKLKTIKKKAVYLMRKDILEALGAIFIQLRLLFGKIFANFHSFL